MNRFAVVLLLLCACSGAARADMGFPGTKPPKVTNRISTSEDLSDFVFLVVRPRSSPEHGTWDELPADQAEIVELSSANPISITGQRRQTANIYMLTHMQAGNGRTVEEVIQGIRSHKILVVYKFSFTFDESVPQWHSDDFTVNYRLQRRSSEFGFELVRTTTSPLWQCWIVFIAFPLAIVIVIGGSWFIRRTISSLRTPDGGAK